MATCSLIQGNTLGCRDAIAGVKEIYIAQIELVTATIGATAQLVDTLTTVTAVGGSAGPAFHKFEVPKNSSNWTDMVQIVANNGGTFYKPTVVLYIPKNNATTANTIKLLGQNQLAVIVKQNDGKYFLLGPNNGLVLEGTGGYASGVQYTDGIGWTITMSGGESSPAYEVPSTLLASVIV